MNIHNVSHTLDDKPIGRSDEIGAFVMKISDDNGASWTAAHTVLHYRQTAIDRTNSWNGTVDIMWAVDQVGT